MLLKRQSFLVVLFLLVATLSASAVQAKITDIVDAINKAGYQRMLTQRMMRDFALVGLGIEYSDPKQDLRRTIDEFDGQLTALQAFQVNSQISDALNSVATQWEPIKKRLEEKPDKNITPTLWSDIEKLLKSSHGVVRLLAAESGEKKGEIINTSGRQRMLSQRMAALYMLRTWRIPNFDFSGKFQQTVKEFKANQSTLEQSALTTEKIGKLLEKTARDFMWFEMSADTKSDSFVPTLILRSSDKILNSMDEATRLYASGI
jgi:nitrate/nitrite-specific signal transduction histidine kinase